MIWLVWWVHFRARRRTVYLPTYRLAVEFLALVFVALTAHLVVPERGAEQALLDYLTPDLKRRFHIHHATLQIERDRCEHGCEADA